MDCWRSKVGVVVGSGVASLDDAEVDWRIDVRTVLRAARNVPKRVRMKPHAVKE